MGQTRPQPSRSQPARVTLQDVARRTGLGRTTVSDILNRNDGSRYSEKTRERVFEAVRSLGYAPSRAGQQLARGRSELVGLMLARDFSNPYWARAVDLIEKELRARGLRMQLAVTEGDAELEMEHMRRLHGDGVEGLIVGPIFEKKDLDQHKSYFQGRLPTVIFGGASEGFDAVVNPNVEQGRLAVEYLLERGHRRIGYLSMPDAAPDTQQGTRHAALRDTLTPRGLYRRQWIVAEPDTGDYNQYYQSALAFAEQWKRTDPADRPTAMLCHNDQVAVAAIAAFAACGVRVPDDISLIGFDNLPESGFLVPPLTSVDGQAEQQMRQAVKLLVDRIQDPERRQQVFMPEARLVERASVRTIA